MRKFTTTPPHLVAARDILSPSDLAARCRAAVGMAMKGKTYSTEDRVDAAAALVATVHGDAHAERRGRPADVSAWIDYVWTYPTLARRYADGIPAEHATMTRLYGMACNLRRTVDRDRLRDAAETAERARRGGFHAGTPSGPPPTPAKLTPAAAHETAREMLGALGVAQLGKLYPVAYAAARETQGNTPDESAAELGMKAATLRKHLERSVKRVPSASVFPADAHAAALGVDEYWTPAGKSGAATLPADDRHRAGDRTPNTATVVPASPITVRHETPTPSTAPAAWTGYVPRNTAARLETASRIVRERAAERTDAERAALRVAHGIPA